MKPKPRRAPPGGEQLLAHIDGGARGNPGPAGYGVHIVRRDAEPGAEPIAELYGFLGVATNNIAEYSALLALLEHVMPMRPASLLVRSDSELLIKQMKGEYRVKDPRLQVLHQAARRMAATLSGVTYEHVPRERNREADALANRAMDSRSASGPLPAALTALPAAPTRNSLPSL